MAEKKFNLDNAMAELSASTGMCSFAESKYANPEDYLDTGCYALNRIITGDVYKGFPTGYITLLAGPSQCGKSYYASRAIISALKKNYTAVFVFDTEGGSVMGTVLEEGLDLKKVKQILVPNADEAIVMMQKVIDFIKTCQASMPNARFLIIFDSIGGLRSKKLANDASNGVNNQDVGTTPRKVGDLITLMTVPCIQTHTAAILLSHTYETFSMTPVKINAVYGGSKILYMPSVSIQARSVPKKADKMTGVIDEDTFYAGTEFTFFTFKNRFVRPFFEAKSLNNFMSGEDRYFGLFDVAEGYGIIQRNGSLYKIPDYSGDKQWSSKAILSGEESEKIWEKIMPIINEKSKDDMRYGSKASSPGEIDMNGGNDVSPDGTVDINSDSTSHIDL